MPIEIGNTIDGSIKAPFRDMQMLAILLLMGAVVFAVSYLSAILIFNSLPAELGAILALNSFSFWAIAELLVEILGLLLLNYIIITFFINMVIVKAFYGKRLNFNKAAGMAASRYLPAVGTEVLILLIFAIPMVVVGGAFALNPILGFIFLMIYLILAVYVGVKLVVAIPAAVIGDKNPFESIKASWKMTKDWWAIFATVLIIGIIILILSYVIALPSSQILQHGIRAQIINSTGAYRTNLNSTSTNQNALKNEEQGILKSVLSEILNRFYSPVYVVVGFVTQAIAMVIESWLIISTVLIYGQLAKAAKRKNKR